MAAVFLLFAVLILCGCPQPSEQVRELAAVEVRDYEGENLSSITDFRENSIRGPQYVDIDSYTLQVSGLVENPRSYTYEEVLAHNKYSKVVTLYCVEGWDATILWEGVLLKDLFDEVGVKPEANTVIFHAYDGYTTSLPLDYLIARNVIIAHKINNVTLPPENGFPFQLVAEDKWGYKWIKWITKIELSDDPEYKGTYESVGYSVSGDVNGPKFD